VRTKLLPSAELRVLMPLEMVAELKAAAAELNISLADLVRLIARTWLRARRPSE
jgi:hypothetical protein